MKSRTGKIRRKTRETDIAVEIKLDGTGRCSIATGIGLMDHMLELLSKHSMADIVIKAQGDLAVDYHHTVEDIGLCLGQALDKALGDRRGIARYGCAVAPMDEALSEAAIDMGGRPYLVYGIATRCRKILDFDLRLFEEFFRALSVQARMNIHIRQRYGRDAHHAHESVFKAFAMALRQAAAPDPRRKGGVPSSKGSI